ncbi:MAG: hypothetical protein M3313_10185 [Actinomycetota bacterium]|nr:hypothetical protein [Actinomycetota bacterium]
MPTPPQPAIPAPAGRLRFAGAGALTAWVNSWLRGAVAYDAAVAAMHDAGIRTVRGLPEHPDPAPVGWALSAVRSRGAGPLRLILPVAGDIRGVPGIAGLSAQAISAGQLVVGTTLAFLPDDDPSADGGWLALEISEVAWVTHAAGDQQTVTQASGALRLAVLDATDALTRLDAARWNSGVDSLRRREQAVLLPPDHAPAAAALATRCAQLTAIIELAMSDAPGGALNGYGAGGRNAALRRLSVAVREALMCAYSWVPESRTVRR